MINIQPAKIDDLEIMMGMINGASKRIAKEGFNQWQKGYPDEETIKRDIEDKNAYLALVDGEVAGMMALSFTDIESYEKIEGKWIDNNFYCSVHRLCVSERFLNKGVATALIAAAGEIASSLGYISVRVDTHEKNAGMIKTLIKCGYTHCGTIRLKGTVEDGQLREAYQKKLV